MSRGLAWASMLGSVALLVEPALADEYQFQKVATIELPGMKGHGDIATFDPSDQMLYVAMPNDGLCVVDTRTNTVVKYIENVPSPNGSDWDANNVYVASGDGAGAGKINDIIVISKETWKEIGRVQTQGTSPDWIGIDRQAGLIYVDSDDNNWMEVYTTGEKPKLKAKWDLFPTTAKTGPDVAALVPSRHTIYQSDDFYVLKVDTSTGAVVAKVDTEVKLTKKGGTKGEVYDAKHNRLWVGTTSKEILVLDADTLATIAKLPQVGGADVVALDPGLGLVYSFEGGANGFDVYDANTMKPVTFIKTGVGNTHTGDIDPETHLVYAFEGDGGVIGVYKPVK